MEPAPRPSLAPIPAARAARWKRLRQRVLPVIVFLSALAVAIALWPA